MQICWWACRASGINLMHSEEFILQSSLTAMAMSLLYRLPNETTLLQQMSGGYWACVLRTLSIKRNEFLSVYKKYTYSCHYHYWSWKSDARCNCLLKSQASGCSRFHKSKLRKHYAVSTRYHKLFRRYTTQSKKNRHCDTRTIGQGVVQYFYKQ